MKRNRFVILFLCFSMLTFSQQKDARQLEREAREDIREGNKLYNQLKFDEAEILYKKALTKTPNYPKASYNLGNTIYQQDRNKEAVNQFELVEKTFSKKINKAETFHNMGNAFMKEKQYYNAVEAYKNSMRNNSKDDETRYNLAMAQELLKKQQQDNKNKKQDNKDDKDKDQKDKKGGDQDKKDEKGKDKEDDKAGDKKDKNDQLNQNKKKDQKPRQNQLSPEQMKQLLEAMNNEENKTLKKLNAKKAKGKKIKQEKDW